MDTLNQRIVDLMLDGKATELAALYAPDISLFRTDCERIIGQTTYCTG
jgi:hypothetical protein